MDMVAGYSLLTRNKVELLYLINEGNVCRNSAMLLKLAAKREIPVIGGTTESIKEGSLFAFLPDQLLYFLLAFGYALFLCCRYLFNEQTPCKKPV